MVSQVAGREKISFYDTNDNSPGASISQCMIEGNTQTDKCLHHYRHNNHPYIWNVFKKINFIRSSMQTASSSNHSTCILPPPPTEGIRQPSALLPLGFPSVFETSLQVWHANVRYTLV